MKREKLPGKAYARPGSTTKALAEGLSAERKKASHMPTVRGGSHGEDRTSGKVQAARRRP